MLKINSAVDVSTERAMKINDSSLSDNISTYRKVTLDEISVVFQDEFHFTIT